MNQAVVHGSNVPDTPSDNNANPSDGLNPVAILVQKNADLMIRKTASSTSVFVGDPLVYTLTVVNNGPATATGVVVTDVLPPQVQFEAVTASAGSCSCTSTIACVLGTVAVNAQVTITVTTRVLAPGNFVNAAMVHGQQPDLTPTNNEAVVPLDAVVQPPLPPETPLPPGENPTTPVAAIPTLSEWGLLILATLLAALGRRRLWRVR